MVGEDIDLVFLVDGLEVECEQGIIIDVVYWFFVIVKCKFIVVDMFGYEQYICNMVIGVLMVDLVVFLVDVCVGFQVQICCYVFIVLLFGICYVVLVVNKIDLVEFLKEWFEEIWDDFEWFVSGFDFESLQVILMLVCYGDNVMVVSECMFWYDGLYFFQYLEQVEVGEVVLDVLFCFFVQWVNWLYFDFCGYLGMVVSGCVVVGDEIVVVGLVKVLIVMQIIGLFGEVEVVGVGEVVILCLVDEIDILCGDFLSLVVVCLDVVDQMVVYLIWMVEDVLLLGWFYLMKIGVRMVMVLVSEIKYKINVNMFEYVVGKMLDFNEIGFCNLVLLFQVVFDFYEVNCMIGVFILIDCIINQMVGVGMVWFVLCWVINIYWQVLEVDLVVCVDKFG